MTVSVATLIEALSRSLRDVVQRELTSDHSRSQLAGVLDILAKLEHMTDWLPAMLQEERDALARGLAAIDESLTAAGVVLPADAAAVPDASAAAYDERTRRLVDWRFEADIAPGLRAEIDSMLRTSLRESVAAQRRRIPRADFSSMTASSE